MGASANADLSSVISAAATIIFQLTHNYYNLHRDRLRFNSTNNEELSQCNITENINV